MHVLILSSYPEKIVETLKKFKDTYKVFDGRIDKDFVLKNKVDFIISFGYKFIIKEEIIEVFKNRIINMHISYLPYNRGAHPNLWSHLDNTKSGISIHLVDNGLDTGQLIYRKEIHIDQDKNTFKSSYILLLKEIEKLFEKKWRLIRKLNYKNIKITQKGTFHFKKEGEKIISMLDKGWDTPINEAIIFLNKKKFF